MTIVSENTTRSYELELSFADYDPQHQYKRGSRNPFRPANSLDEAFSLVSRMHKDFGITAWVAMWFHETTTTETITIDDLGRKLTTTLITVQEDARIVYRSFEGWSDYQVKADLRQKERKAQELI